MRIKLNAAARILAADDDWFHELSDTEQKNYLKQHPGSHLGRGKGSSKPETKPDKSKNDNGDYEYLQHLKARITNLRGDIEDTEADGEDASRERKQLKESMNEYRELVDKLANKFTSTEYAKATHTSFKNRK